MDDKDLLDWLVRLRLACGELSSADRLEVLGMAWITTATEIRTEALAEPGGFPAARALQVAVLRSLADVIEIDEPNLELERLFAEGKFEEYRRAIAEHLRPRPDAPSADED